MSVLPLPEPIAAYFAADTQGPENVARCFSPQAVVTDMGQIHRGRKAIEAWKVETSTRYAYATDPFSVALINGVHEVYSRVAGSFPGSPVDLKFSFRLERGLIAGLEITA